MDRSRTGTFAWLAAISTAGLMVAAAAAPTLAADKSAPAAKTLADDRDVEKIDFVGRPAQFKAGKRALVAVWFEGGSWHIRATAKENKKELIEGAVTVRKGKIVSGKLDGVEEATPPAKPGKNAGRDRKQRQREHNDDDLVVRGDRAGFDFRFVNRGGADGVSFKLSDKAEAVTFSITVAGDGNPKQILIGKGGVNPKTSSFTLRARPAE